ncbi:(d)CMP kinase [Nakamurella silvestris]|nr:(d)CMP kinase [Nakamurella silvestris]
MSSFVIAIDGPSGTGKSTVSRRVAAALGAGYLDTGAMYRIVTLAVLNAGVDPADDEAVAALLPTLTFASPTDPVAQNHELDGVDVGQAIRSHEVTAAVSPVSANPAVRLWLKERQQELAHSGRMVVEGRDIGTVIAPGADLKIYLTADEGVRAARRHRDYAPGAGALQVDAVQTALAARDRFDSTRAHAPLRAAEDSVEVDSTHFEIEDTVAAILRLAGERGIS